jgi:SAM-dependent methyltransferase
MRAFAARLLADPRARHLDVDDPGTTVARRAIIANKPPLRRIYEEWYEDLAGSLPPGPGTVLEVGAGPGFLAERLPGLVTSEVFVCAGLRAALDARALPFRAGSLRAILMTDVFHHVSDAGRFLREASEALRPGGRIVMVEPWVTPWSRFVYGRLHHEPFDPRAADWTFPPGGPLSAANGALPWIVFARDRERFRRELPGLRLVDVAPRLPFRYLLSGGFSVRALIPEATFGLVARAEARLGRRAAEKWAMFARIVVERV